MNNKKIEPTDSNIVSNVDDEITIENIWKNDFLLLMKDMKNIQIQINVVKEKLDQLRKNRLFMKNTVYILR
jgi:hypothetical protein